MNLEQAIDYFNKINDKTGILTNDSSKPEPSKGTGGEREELWNITRIFLSRIYELDIEDNSLENKNEMPNGEKLDVSEIQLLESRMIGDRDTHILNLKGIKRGGTWKMPKIIGKL